MCCGTGGGRQQLWCPQHVQINVHMEKREVFWQQQGNMIHTMMKMNLCVYSTLWITVMWNKDLNGLTFRVRHRRGGLLYSVLHADIKRSKAAGSGSLVQSWNMSLQRISALKDQMGWNDNCNPHRARIAYEMRIARLPDSNCTYATSLNCHAS